MWQHNYAPVAGSMGLSAIVAAIPIVVLFVMLGVLRRPAWMAALSALGSAVLVALVAYGMPVSLAIVSALYGAAFGLFPIAWVVFASVMLYRLAVDTGKFEIIKDSVGSLTNDRRLQALFIAFAFGAFIEGAAGFGAPVAVAGAMLAGLGFSPFYAAGICLLANTAPVAFGSIGIPVITLANVTGLPVLPLSAMVGRLSATVSIIIPAYLVVVMAGGRRALEVLPAIVACGVSFAGMQFFVSNYIGPELTDIMSSLTCIVVMVIVLKVWKPKTIMRLEGDTPVIAAVSHRTPGEVFMAWVPYVMLVVFVLVWGEADVKAAIDRLTHALLPGFLPVSPTVLNGLEVPWLHNAITRVPPVTAQAAPYGAVYTLNWLSASGTACLLATIVAAGVLRVKPRQFGAVYQSTFRQLALPMLTIASMLGLAYLMNYSGMTSTLGLALSGTGVAFPFFSAVLGWLGVFLTGSDTSANALFGNLQVVTANALGLNPVLTASVNSAAGVMGKMISIQSIAVAVAATGMTTADESRLFRFTIKHSLLLMLVMAVISMLYAYVFPEFVPVVGR
ncbi:MAG: lactate permease [Acidobacteria bacterium RIFCSPLOWO2_12_FULL_67_14]|nr:MAG: lactate permease [Acidobacteria bacterium RIFCSPLOWO2_02_FULL_67_21]OFW35860.1 MAG: lactate permease [Acidobacteria bacterium RIFCSPLOWO2_12_FULL_67_14]